MANPMMCLQADAPPTRRVTRPPIVFHQRETKQQQQTQNICVKTKGAICFLCLFDGLRTPTIRRLSRKPRLICNRPLLTFDPSVFAPSSQNAIQNLYMNSLKCSADIVVDPPVKDALDMMHKLSQNATSERVILHYFGQGCNQPSPDGSIFFFSEDRARYKPVKLEVLFQYVPGPICVIVDCPSAAVLANAFSTHKDTLGFFACSQNEQMPISTDAPWDLFSSCLLSPFETALWWHTRRHSCVFEIPERFQKVENTSFIKQFFFALLEAIAFDTQPQGLFEQFTKDPAMTSLARGFVLSQRVMQSFNLHPVSLPALKPTSSHDLWFFWDTAIDCALAMPDDVSSRMIFKLFIESFHNFPTVGVMPIFSFFITRPEFREESVRVLIDYIDNHSDVAESAARSNIARTIVEMNSINNNNPPSASTCLLLAKLLSIGVGTSPFQQQWVFWFKETADAADVKAGLLSICCAISNNFMSSFTKIHSICIKRAIDCAPYSALLIGLLMQRAVSLINLPPFGSNFLPLLDSESPENRLACAFLMGNLKERSCIPKLVELLSNENEKQEIRCQCAISLGLLMKQQQDPQISQALAKAARDKDRSVAELAQMMMSARVDQAQEKFNILKLLMNAVKRNGFYDRYYSGLIV
ncbi:hypothetical protein TVAG_370410 [Trichomonas vaginalis G3]|uniref:Raptor N-terminal CASPase-like domain-containing protein n=1 Tax=Trichomonas vaginalis (strain ATCC PRA-98 / G3) TaxID=412133 RepID=A2FJN8_TRIV3|nr:TOR signaling [Trichomonas vaginalis G3]EAX94870.1 hypothetical protein TVAG_370410 [Trichomonas vaginalis G3]KAI5541506.1 TOR signaling [Trichomonas vaginalis G3]|eukprot:XP_001307800.1 hypothetical protein [Trichomonas vaginalis G3]